MVGQTQKRIVMAILFNASGKTNPTQTTAPMLYYPRAIHQSEIDLEALCEQISQSTTLTEADCQAVVYALVQSISTELGQGKIVRLGHLGSFQISIKGTPSQTPDAVHSKDITSASITYRPGKRFKAMLKKLEYLKKK